jgi:hypothetical protein
MLLILTLDSIILEIRIVVFKSTKPYDGTIPTAPVPGVGIKVFNGSAKVSAV